MTFDAAAAFGAAFDQALAADVDNSGFPVSEWFLNGVTKPENAIAKWRIDGPMHVKMFMAWFESSDYEVWIAPDGRPAIELELRPKFGDIEVHMFVDLVLVNQHGLCVVDTKSGAKIPYSLQQQAMYACGIELTYGIRPLYGANFLSRGTGPKGCAPEDKTYFQTPRPLSEYRYSVEFFTRELEQLERGLSGKVFIANVGDHCDRCGVAYACTAVGGSEGRKFDPAHPQYAPS